jgi:hypothetical protein
VIHFCVYYEIKWILKDLNKITDLLKSSPLMSRFFSILKSLRGLLIGEGRLLGILRYVLTCTLDNLEQEINYSLGSMPLNPP